MKQNRILIVEDDDDTRAMLDDLLREEGYEVESVAEGTHVPLRFSEKPFDLVITDVLVPGKDGLEIIQELKHLSSTVQFLAISGGGSTLTSDDCLHSATILGAHKTLTKPFRSTAFLEAVHGMLSAPRK